MASVITLVLVLRHSVGNCSNTHYQVQCSNMPRLITSCWVSCNGLASNPRVLFNTPGHFIRVSRDGLTFNPGGSSNVPSHFMQGIP